MIAAVIVGELLTFVLLILVWHEYLPWHQPPPPAADHRDEVMKERERQRVVVTMKSGAAYTGVLFVADGSTVLLRESVVLANDGTDPVPVDGELMLARSDLEYIQCP